MIKYPVQAVVTFTNLVKKRPDVIVVQNPPIFAALTCLVYSKLYSANVIIDHHLLWSMSGFIQNPILKSPIKAVEEFCVKRALANTTYADDWERELSRFGAETAITIYDFVDESWMKEADPSIRKELPSSKKVVVMPCGTGHVLERPDLLIEASKDIEELVVVVTGNLRYLTEHVEKARSLGARNVVFTGFLSDAEYRGLILTCDFVANISNEPYGIPHTITEALAAGRPVMISRNPSVTKLLGDDYPLVIPNNNVETIRDKIRLALGKEDELERQARAVYARLKKKREEQVNKFLRVLYSVEEGP